MNKQECGKDIANQIFKDLEEHNAGWDGISVNAYWVKKIKERYGVSTQTRELGVNIQPFETRL